ncbi:hypothetical protein LguiB_027197 [Lonicera macranthoides]
MSIALHAANFAFIGLLVVFIQVKFPESPTAFETHNVSMTTSLISVCLYAFVVILRMMVKALAQDITCCQLIFNHSLVFFGILTPTSLLSVFLPYNPFWLISFICALFLTILSHYLFQIKKAHAVISKVAHLPNFANGVDHNGWQLVQSFFRRPFRPPSRNCQLIAMKLLMAKEVDLDDRKRGNEFTRSEEIVELGKIYKSEEIVELGKIRNTRGIEMDTSGSVFILGEGRRQFDMVIGVLSWDNKRLRFRGTNHHPRDEALEQGIQGKMEEMILIMLSHRYHL